jgi:hypothetical protein
VSTPFCTLPAAGQRKPDTDEQRSETNLQFKLIREFKDAGPFDISPDGRYACLGFNRRGKLQVVELETGRAIYNTELREDVLIARFFADGETLYAQTSLIDENERYRRRYQQAVIDLRTGNLNARLCDYHLGYFPLAAPFLLGGEHNSADQGVALFLAKLPDYQETLRVPFAPFARRYPKDPDGYSPTFSANRKRVVHQVDHALVCRSTEDLSVIWTRPVEPDYHWGAWQLDMTPDGQTLASAVIDQSALHPQRYYVGIYDGTNGSVLARLPISAAMGVRISPDGKLIAVGERVVLPDGRIEPTVNLYEALTGVRVGKVSDSAVAVAYSRAGISGRFTPDGKYLVTAGRDTKVWALA